MISEDRKKLYDALSSEYDLGTYEEFERNIGDSVKRRKLYDAASADYDLGDFESYSQRIGPTHKESLDAFTAEYGSWLDDFEARDSAETNMSKAGMSSGIYVPAEGAITGEERKRYMELHKQEEALKKAWFTSDEYLAQKDADALFLSDARKGLSEQMMEYAQANPVLRQEGPFQINPYATRGAEADTELEKYRTASRILDDAINMHNAPSKYDGANVWQNIGKFGKGAADTLSDVDFWSMGLTEIADNLGVRDVLSTVQEKLGNLNDLSEESIENILSPAEKAVLQAWAINTQEQLKRKDDLSRGYQAGKGAAESLGFMAEFALTGGIGKAATEGVEQMAKWLGKKALTKVGGMTDDVAAKVLKETGEKIAQSTVGKYGVGLAESLAEAAGRTGVMPSTFRNISEKAAEIETDENGNNYLVKMNDAFAKGYVDSFIENLSEGGRIYALGTLFGDVAGKIPAYKKMVDKFSHTKASELWDAFNSSGVMNTLRAGGWHGLGEEYLEEWYGNALRTLTGVDKEALKDFATVDNQIVTLTSFLPMTIFGGTVSTAQVLSANKDLEKKAAALKSALMERGYDEAQANNMIDMMRGAAPAEVSETLTPIVNSVANRNTNEAAALMKPVGEFAAAVQRWQSFNTKYNYQEQEQRDGLRTQMEENLGQFWQQDENGRQTVQRGVNEKGEVVYMLGKPRVEDVEAGVTSEVAAVTSDGRKVFVNPSEYQLEDELEMNTFLGNEIMAEKGNQEQARMIEEKEAKIAAIREAAVPGTAVNIGTAEAPMQAIVIQRNPDGVIVNTPDGQTRQMTYEEFGNYVGINAVPMTDAQIDEHEADVLTADRVQREAALDQEYNNDDAALDELAEAEDEIEQAVDTNTPLPMKADGSVDQTALWNNDPERWAQWNDEQRQDGGANSLAYVSGAIAKEQAKIAELQAAYAAESDFDARDAIEKEIADTQARVGRLTAIQQGYVAQAEAAAAPVVEAEPVAPRVASQMSEQEKAAMDAQHQARLDAARSTTAKREAMQNYINEISQGSVPMTLISMDEYEEVMKDAGCTPNQIAQVKAAIRGAKRRGQMIPAFFVPRVGIFAFVENIPNIEQLRLTYVHERQHQFTGANNKYLNAILQLGLSRERMAEIVYKLSGSDFYKDDTAEALADEIISYAMERAYTYEDFSVVLQELGIEQGIIDIITEIDNEQRNEDSTYSSRRRGRYDLHDNSGRQGDRAENDRNQEPVSSGLLDKQRNRPLDDGSRRTGSTGEGAEVISEEQLNAPNSGTAQQITATDGEVLADTNGKGGVRFSIRTWNEGGRDYLASWLANDTTLTEEEKADILARMDEFYKNALLYSDTYAPFGTWSDAGVRYDNNGNPLMSVIKANGDYAMNLDFSLVCKKRRPLNRLLRTLVNRNAFATYTLRERELAEINWILQEHGFEVACALCFVDSKRYRVTGVADVFAALYNRLVKSLAPEGVQIAHFNYNENPNVEVVENGLDTMSDDQLNWDRFDRMLSAYKPGSVEHKVAQYLREHPEARKLVDATDFIEAEGFESVKKNNPDLLKFYNMKKGTGGPKASFGDVQYLNDILKKEKSFDAEKAYAVGGVRLQSFSDFVPHMYFDYMQLFAELAAKKLPLHAYTKEVLFAKIFGLTGAKINMSLVPAVVEGGIAPGLDAEGNYAWADPVTDTEGNVIQQGQSFPYDEAMAIQKAEGYSKNCGIIAVGISDAHIEKMLDDPNIPFIIPYHKSSLNAIVARMTNIDQYKDYTNVQNTRKASGSKLDKGTKDFNFNEYLHGLGESGTPQQAAQAYLDWCRENNYKPKFSQFAYHPNYYKLLQDFNTIDLATGEYAPQGAVTMTFPTEENAFGNVETLIQQGLQEDAELEEKMEQEIDGIADQVLARLEEISKEPKMSEKQQAKKMAELADERIAKIRERAEQPIDVIEEARRINAMNENADVAFRFIGEMGAIMIDRANEAHMMMDLLEVAREMVQDGRSEREIKLATGWERGADGKWRYEEPDFTFKTKPGRKKTFKLSELIEDETLFEAYPEFKDIQVKFTKLAKGKNGEHKIVNGKSIINLSENLFRAPNPLFIDTLGAFQKNHPEIYNLIDSGRINKITPEQWDIFNMEVGIVLNNQPEYIDEFGARETLAHEIQHAIQRVEGFARGGAASMIDTTDPQVREERNALKSALNVEMDHLNYLAQKYHDTRNKAIEANNSGNKTEGMRLILESDKIAKEWLSQKTLVGSIERDLKKLKRLGDEGYKKLAGEVEARNVMSRLNMSFDERRQSLYSDTQDVATEEQIFLRKNIMQNYHEMMSPSVSFRITPEMDADYLAAVERGDMETAQRMVIEAAKLAMPNTQMVDEDGNPMVMIHNTASGDFTVFDPSRSISPNGAMWFANEKGQELVGGFDRGERDVRAFLNITNPNREGMDAAGYALEEGYDGVIVEQDGAAVGVVYNPSQIKSADPVTYDDSGNVIPLSERFNPENEDIRFSIIGERGALRDKTEEGLTRLDNLDVARQMESQLNPDWSAKNDENALKIKVATGWERGADGLWRYEVDDIVIKHEKEWMDSKKKLTLRDIVEPNPIFDMYPDLLDIKIVKDRSKYSLGASYNHKKNEMKLPFGALKDDADFARDYGFSPRENKSFLRTLEKMTMNILHEVQHAIQDREGFAAGGNSNMLLPKDREQYASLVREYNTLAEEYNAILNKEGYSQAAKEKGAQADKKSSEADQFLKTHRLGESGYKRLAGEVEANNVENRSKLSDYERYNSLLASTEDVARKDQIFLMDAVETAEATIRFRMSNENQAIFVSNAAKAVEGIKMEKATPEQWLKMIEKNGGLKAGEDKWMGLSDWLKASDKKTLTKQEVLDFINENMIIIEEQHYGEMDEETREFVTDNSIINMYGVSFRDSFNTAFVIEENFRGEWYVDVQDYEEAVSLYNEHNEDKITIDPADIEYESREETLLKEWATSVLKNAEQNDGVKPINTTRMNFTTEGLDNKHEIALTVPTMEPWNEEDEIHFGDAGDGRAVAWIRFGDTQIIEEGSLREYEPKNEIEKQIKDYIEFCVSDGDSFEESVGYAYNLITDAPASAPGWTEEAVTNVADGMRAKAKIHKVLVIDEIQSKRHQEGREKGYRSKDYWKRRTDYLAARTMHDSLYDEMKEKYGDDWINADTEGDVKRLVTEEEFARLVKANEEFDAASDAYKGMVNAIPDAPFDKNWHELAMKRMLRYAAENGYDVIAWTKGEQQAERYNLAKAVQGIEAWDRKPSSKIVRIKPQIGMDILLEVDSEGKIIDAPEYTDYKGKQLSELVGKDLALAIMQPGDVNIEEAGLRIGGEGMKGFYDKMLPAFMNKYGKKWGVKVEDIHLNLEGGLDMHSIPVTDEMKASVMEGQVMFRTTAITQEVQDEMDAISATAIVRGNYLKAPNGADTNLTPEQWAMVRTKNFLNWFGDWINDPENASKVVDENGEPKVVYHQTNAVVYINRETGENWDELDWRARQEWDERDDWEDYWEEQDFNTFSRVNARITNEFDGFFFAPEYDEYHEYGDRTIAAFVNIKNPASREDYHIDSRYNDAGRNERIRLQEAGFDGVIRMDGDNVDEYIAFEPNQIKSATDNTGEFSKENDDIRFRMTDSKGNTLTPDQEKFFANSKAVDKDGNLLVLYHGTPRAGFTEFKSGWFTTSKEDAISYSGDRKGRLFDPNEKYEPETLTAGDFRLGYMTFDSEEDRAAFLGRFPYADEVMSEREYEDARMGAEDEEYDALTARRKEFAEVWNAYREYERERFVDTTIADLIANPEAYTEEDLMRAMLEYDSNASFDNLDDMSAEERKDALVSALQNANEETEGGISDIVVPTRVPRNGEGVKHNDLGNRTYEVYANVENPYEIDANGRGSEFGSGDIYKAVEEGLADGQYDGVIVRNWRVGRTQQLGDVVVPKNGSQIKLTSNENPTESSDIQFRITEGGEESDIRFSIRTKPAPEHVETAYKLFNVDENGNPHALFIDGANALERGVWYDADSPLVKDLEKLEPGFTYLVDKDGNAIQKQYKNKQKSPSKAEVEEATANGSRYILVGQYANGKKSYHNWGINGSGQVSKFAMRPGWHLTDSPSARHIGEERNPEKKEEAMYRRPNQRWFKVEYAADVDYNEEAASNPTKDIQTRIPEDGYYSFKTNTNANDVNQNWIISGSIRILDPLSREEVTRLNSENGVPDDLDYREEPSFRTTGTPTDEVVANGLQLTPAQTAEVAANIFAALPEESRKKITEGLNGNVLGLKDAILQIPTSLASKESWNEEDKQMADVVAEEMTKIAGEMTRPFSAEEGLWLLYNNLNKGTDLISQASRALVQRNLGFDAETLAKQEQAKEDVRFRTVGDATSNAQASLYNRGAVNVWTRLKESFVDMQASVEELVKAIEKRTGKVAQGFENILLALNQQSSKGLAAMESYTQKFLNPMFDEIRRIMDETKMKYEDVVRYVILKHGLERNKKLAQRDARAHYQEIYDDIISKITGMTAAQKRTYLTNAQLKEGDAKAELATLQAVDMSAMTDEEKREHKKKLAAARKAVEEAEEYLKRAQKIASLSEQEAQDELDKIFEKIENGTDSVFKEMRENDYSGISSMFYDQLGVDRKNFSTEEQYQAALMEAKKDRYSSLKDIEAAAEAEVKSFEGKTDTKELWKRINAATKETLRQQYEANMISKDQYLNLRDMFEYYVPLRGFKDNTAEDMYTYYRKPNSTGYTKPILGAEGRKTEAESPFGWIAAMAGSAIASNVKNEAKLALYYFVSNRPENGIATISKTWFVHTAGDVDERGKKIFRPAYPPFSEDLSSAEAKAQYEIWQANMKELQKQGQAYEAGQRLNLGNAVVNISDANKPEHIVNVKVGGKDYTIIINGNPRAAQAINGDLNIEGTAQDYSALFGPVLRWMSSVNTSYNPEFWITNMMRDMAFTMMAVNIKEDPAYRRKFSKNYRKAFKVVSLVAKNEKGTIGDSYLEQQYKDFVKYGGVTGYTQIKDSETWEKEIDNYLSSNDPKSVKNGKVMRGMKSAFHVAHRFGESLEQVSRFAAFLTARETGKSINEAINDAKEITVNFNRKGSGKMITLEEAKYLTGKNGQPLTKPQQWMVVGLSSIAPLGRRFIMFFNAAIQGLNATYKLMKKNPKRFTGWALGYAAVGMMNAALHAMLDDDDDYLDIPQYERRNSLMIGGNGAYFKWALPQEARAFYALGDLAVETVMGRNPHQNVIGEALKIGTEILPVNPSEGWKAFMPSVAIPFIELALNEDYKGAPIYNEQKWLSEEEKERTAKWSSAYQGTGWIYVKIAQGLNFITGGDKHDAGFINLQPEKLEHLVQSAFGGTIRTADKFINTISAAIDPEEPMTIRQTPFLNRFLTINDERFKNVHVNDVFDYYKADAEHALTLEKQYTKDRDIDALTKLRSSDEYQWAKIYGKYKKPLKAIQDKIKVADGTAEKKELMKQQDELKKRMIKEISEL